MSLLCVFPFVPVCFMPKRFVNPEFLLFFISMYTFSLMFSQVCHFLMRCCEMLQKIFSKFQHTCLRLCISLQLQCFWALMATVEIQTLRKKERRQKLLVTSIHCGASMCLCNSNEVFLSLIEFGRRREGGGRGWGDDVRGQLTGLFCLLG